MSLASDLFIWITAQLPSKMSAPAIAHLVMHCMDEQHFSAARAQTLPTAMYPPINLGLVRLNDNVF
jgi:hypothetical protein